MYEKKSKSFQNLKKAQKTFKAQNPKKSQKKSINIIIEHPSKPNLKYSKIKFKKHP
jgi:hypothetical protein